MAAKHKTTKKTFKRKATSRRQQKPVESVMPDHAQQPITSVAPFQQAQPVQPIQPIQAQPVQAAQPMQTVPLSDTSQPAPVQEASSFESSMTQPVVGSSAAPAAAPTDALADAEPSGAEPEIKIGIENKLDAEVKSTSPKPDSSQGTMDSQNKTGQKKNLLLPILVIVLLGAAVLGGLFIYRQNFSNKVEEKINEVTLQPSPTEKPTPKPLDLSKFEIEILNGSGVAGEASNQKNNLETAGFKVASIGNADNSDYAKTVIRAKKEVEKDFLDKLKTTLEKSFKVISETLDEDAKTDVIVIIGSEDAE